MAARVGTYREFWPFYLREHARRTTRWLHVFGTSLAAALLVAAAVAVDLRYLLAAVISGYLFAWIAHFTIEHNRPATFRYPLWSLRADWHMWGLFWVGKLNAELRRHGLE